MIPIRRLLLTIAGNALIAAFLTALGVGGGWEVNLVISQCIGLSIFSVCNLAGWLVPAGQWHAAAVIAAVPVGVVLGLLLGAALTGFAWGVWPTAAWQAVTIGVALGVMGSGFFYLRERNQALLAEVQLRENRRLEAEKQSLAAQLRMLQAQIEPHFLFNSLANVAALIDAEPKLAGRLLDALIRYLRASLMRTRAEGGTLGDEVALLTAYLDVLKIRMGDRLDRAFDIAPGLLDHAFPPMLLQPLVENAIRHGLEPKVAGGRVTVAARRQGDRLWISVVDDGLGFSQAPGEGLGLANVRARLAAIYGPTARLDLRSGTGAGVEATIDIPAGDAR